jgi:phosphate:Na+ symporter
MIPWQTAFTLIPGIILFLYGIEHFSEEILAVAKGKFNRVLATLTATPLKAAGLGAFVTAIIQSSAATTVITMGLVNGGVISFVQSLGIIIGSNVGTTITAQLVAFRLTSFGPVFILLGFIIGLVGKQYKFLGKPTFYFGLVFFSLSLLSGSLAPFQNDPEIIGMLSRFSSVPLALLAGFLFTVLFQSSSVTSGIVVVLAQGGFITLPHAILLIFGANIGSTATPILASATMGLYARRSAVAHLIFNFGGVLLIIPFFSQFQSLVLLVGGTGAQEVANAHLFFNLIAAILFLLFVRQFEHAVERIVPGEEREVLLKTKYLAGDLPDDSTESFDLIEKEIQRSFDITRELFGDSVRLLDNDSRDVRQKIAKLKALSVYLDDEIERALQKMSRRHLNERDAKKTVIFIRMSNLIVRLGDWAYDFAETSGRIARSDSSVPAELKADIAETYCIFDRNMEVLRVPFPGMLPETREDIKQNDILLRENLNANYRRQLGLITREDQVADSIVIELLSILENANGLVHVMRKLAEMYAALHLSGHAPNSIAVETGNSGA